MAPAAELTPAEARAVKVAEMKVDAQEKRGIGIVRVSAYLEGVDHARGRNVVPDGIVVSISDYFEDETVSVQAETEDGIGIKTINSKENKGCRIAKSELATAAKVLTFPYTGPTKITITHGEHTRTFDLNEKVRRAYFVLGENES